ncbi:hypothetical protein INT47_003187 [Mucor saturninus]|uniref:Uncharacterized protein n=1 Tax=Mucor saturninus TaxID=64648 RepID=A0A8H7QZ35_9FUNG|nr:hypothetical protein INT47_003187 [Mucor saturninus]
MVCGPAVQNNPEDQKVVMDNEGAEAFEALDGFAILHTILKSPLTDPTML